MINSCLWQLWILRHIQYEEFDSKNVCACCLWWEVLCGSTKLHCCPPVLINQTCNSRPSLWPQHHWLEVTFYQPTTNFTGHDIIIIIVQPMLGMWSSPGLNFRPDIIHLACANIFVSFSMETQKAVSKCGYWFQLCNKTVNLMLAFFATQSNIQCLNYLWWL